MTATNRLHLKANSRSADRLAGPGPDDRNRGRVSAGAILRWAGGALVAFLFVAPVLWMISGSLKPTNEVFATPPNLLPHHVVTGNYSAAVHYISFGTYLRNSVIVTIFSVIGTLVCCVPAAYALAILVWRGKRLVFAIVLFGIMLPFPAVMIPWYIIFKQMGFIGSLLPLTVPPFFGQFVTPAFSSALAIFLLRQFLLGIPKELIQAARVDGAGPVRIMLQVVLPLARPVIATVVIMTVLSSWTAFIGPLLFLNKSASYTLSIGLQQYQSQHFTAYNLLLAASVLFIIPVVVVFLFGQRYFVRGAARTGLK
jgi:multiple sugar transport system permease protein